MNYNKNKIWFEYKPENFEDVTHYSGDILRLKVAVENIWINPAYDFIKLPQAYILTYIITEEELYNEDTLEPTGEFKEVETLITDKNSPYSPRELKDHEGKQKILTNDYKVNPQTLEQDDNGIGEYTLMSKLKISDALDILNMTKSEIGKVEILTLIREQIEFWINLMYNRGNLKL